MPRKRVTLIRHGQTEMNVFLATHPWNAADFKDPELVDTRLTAEGEAQARRIAGRLPPPDLLVSSPLRRALCTAQLVFPLDNAVPFRRLVHPLCRERLYHSSDVGRAPALLAAEHPAWDGFDALPPVWWHTSGLNGGDDNGSNDDPLSHTPEPEGLFLQRVQLFLDWLVAQPEENITVVSHWGVIDALTSTEFQNAEARTYDVNELAVRQPLELVPPG